MITALAGRHIVRRAHRYTNRCKYKPCLLHQATPLLSAIDHHSFSSTSTPPPPPPSSSSSFSSSSTPQLPPSTPLPPQTTHNLTALDETYRHITQNQSRSLLALREKTTINVRRALMGNLIITTAKLGAWLSSGSSAMLSEFVHSVVDCGNQSLLLVGLRDSGYSADRRHPYGYGKSVYFWALVSALGTFWLGAGISLRHSLEELIDPSLNEITWQVWAVLGVSLGVDGWVLMRTVRDVKETMPKGVTFMDHVRKLRDPAMIAILLEDGAACAGIVMASCGIVACHVTQQPIFDGLAGGGISCLLAGMGLVLVRLNQRFLLGQAVDADIIAGIEKILLNRSAIDNVHSVQSQWTGPDTFSYKAEVDFDGTYLAAKLMPRYQKEFIKVKDTMDKELNVLLSWYAEDVVRTVEREVRHIEAEIRMAYPGATYIELEPDSKYAERFAIDDGMEAQLKRIEIESLNRFLKKLNTEFSKSLEGAAVKDANNKDKDKEKTSKEEHKNGNIEFNDFDDWGKLK